MANPTFGDTAGAMVVLNKCVVSQGDTGSYYFVPYYFVVPNVHAMSYTGTKKKLNIILPVNLAVH